MATNDMVIPSAVLLQASNFALQEGRTIGEILESAMRAYRAQRGLQVAEIVQNEIEKAKAEFNLPNYSEDDIVDLVKEIRRENFESDRR